MRNPFQWFARQVDAAGLGVVDAPQLEDTKPLLSPSELLPTDAEQIASLTRQLNAANAHVERLQEQLLARPAAAAADRHCANCAGMERTVREVERERAELRRKLAGYQLAATRGQQVRYVEPVP
jgi:hypothetical protein